MTASRRPADTQSIRSLIDQQIVCAHTLLGTLEQERQALLGNSLETLEQACAEKQAAASTLQSLNGDLLKLGNSPREIEELIRDTDPADSIRGRWNELLALAARCQKANLGNGALLDERQSQLRRSLRHSPLAAPGALYGRGGDTGLAAASRRLASA